MAQYDELLVYQAAHDLLLAIFQFTKNFSKTYKATGHAAFLFVALRIDCAQRLIQGAKAQCAKPNV
jgi:hypothetical protein